MKQILTVMLLLLQTAAFSQDLIVTNYAGPTTFSRYEEFAPDITVKNSGIVSVNETFFAAAYLSTDDQWQNSDILVNSIYKYQLGPGESYTGKPTRASVNAPPGTYYLIIKVDNSTIVTETDETNNLLVIPNVVINPPDVDFTLTTFVLDKSTYTQNSVVKPSYILQNLGTTNTGDVVVIRFILSANTTVSQDDHSYIALEAEVLTGPDSFTSDEDLNITLPTVANGNYYILAWVDYQDDFEETNEANNVFAIPITIQSSNVDLVIINAYSSYSSGMLSSQITIRNNGTTGVSGYDVAMNVIPMGQPPNGVGVSSPIFDGYLGPNDEKVFFVHHPVYSPPPGTYYVAFTVNSQNNVQESITWNNLYTDYSPVIYVPIPATPGVTFNSLTVSAVDDTDQQINLNLNLTNSGNTSSFNENYAVIVKNAQNTTLHSQQSNVWIDFSPGETVNKPVALSLSSSLPVGTYQISVSCTSGCYTNPSSRSISLTVTPTEYTLTGTVKAEDGQAITNGKLFLYEDDGLGNIKFIQKIVPYSGPSFSFPVDANPHTLYFIPDPIQYPNYVPTIYGKTVVLQESNFFTPSANMNVAFEILSVNSPGLGTGIINGHISSENNSSGRLAKPLSVEPVPHIPVILLSQSGQVVGIAYTDESGFYEFVNIPRNAYQVMPSFELDNLLLTEPFAVDITDKNMSVDLVVKADGIYPSAAQFLLPQLITFNAFSTYQYGDPSIAPDAQSDVGLPIEYESSDESIAAVENGKIVIKGIGNVIITAKQPGNNFYLAASVNRSLTIIKADQHVTLSSFAAKTYGDDPFSIESSSSADLDVSFSSSDPSIAAVSGNTIAIHGAGTVKITAEQPGNEFYNAAPPLQKLLTINKAAQAISFDDLPEQNVDAGLFVLTGSASSGLALTFESSDEEIVSIVGNIATVHKDGVVNITAHQPGNQNYLAADDVVRSQVVNVVLGIEPVDLSKHIYPNPTRDFVFLQIPEVKSVEVLDVVGRIRKDIVWIEGKIDFSCAESGLYFVKVLFQNRTEVMRVIKN